MSGAARRPRTAQRRMIALALGLCCAAMGVITLHAAPARADADPASDTLLVQDAFYPYQPSTPAPLQQDLGRALAEIHATGLNLKVAIIGGQIDLGGIPQLFGQVARYARFLDTEISLKGPQPLLVVMPDGAVAVNAGPSSALSGLTVDRTHGSAGLTRTAVAAVQRIAAARGRAITPVAVSSASSSGSGGGSAVLLAVAAAALMLVASAVGWRVLRRRARSAAQSPGGNA